MGKFVRNIFIIGAPVIIVALLCLYYKFSVRPQLTGGLGELGKFEFGQEYDSRMDITDYPDYRVVTLTGREDSALRRDGTPQILTMGDSFSQQGRNGYQNIMAHHTDTAVFNLKWAEMGIGLEGLYSEQMAISLLNTGFFDSIPNAVMILEGGERYFADRFLNLNFESGFFGSPPRMESRMSWQKEFADWLRLKTGLSDNPVLRARLSRNFFSHPRYASDLFFYYEDLERLDISPSELSRIEANLRRLHEMFAARGIPLIYVVVPDKYDVYEDYIIDNPFGPKPQKDRIMALQERLPWLIFPLDDLKARLEAGEEDVYMVHDTHWSAKGAAVLSDMLLEKIGARGVASPD